MNKQDAHYNLFSMSDRIGIEFAAMDLLAENEMDIDGAIAEAQFDYDLVTKEVFDNLDRRLDENGHCTYCGGEGNSTDVPPAHIEYCHVLKDEAALSYAILNRLRVSKMVMKHLADGGVAIAQLATLQAWGQATGDWGVIYNQMLEAEENFSDYVQLIKKNLAEMLEEDEEEEDDD